VLAALDAQYPGQVRITDVAYGRSGGMMGFFAKRRVGVHYTLTNFVDAALPTPAPTLSAEPLDELLRAAEAAERARDIGPARSAAERRVSSAQLAATIVESGRAPAGVDGLDDETTNVEFARMLLEMASQKAAERRTATPPAPSLAAPLVTPTPAPPIRPPLPPISTRPANPIRPGDPAALFAPANPMPAAPASSPPPVPQEAPVTSTLNPPASWTPIETPRPGRRRAAGAHRAADEPTSPAPVSLNPSRSRPSAFRRSPRRPRPSRRRSPQRTPAARSPSGGDSSSSACRSTGFRPTPATRTG